MNENQIGDIIVASAIHLHRGLGPGLLETVYEVTLARELEKRGLKVQRKVPGRSNSKFKIPNKFKSFKFKIPNKLQVAIKES